jgi:hypothetical protein
MRRLLVPTLIALCLAAVLAACGGEERLSPADYQAKLASLDRREGRAHAEAEKALIATSVAEIRRRMSRFAADQQDLGDVVADLNPPKDAEAANDQLARGARQLAAEIRAAVRALSSADSAKAAVAILNRRLSGARGARQLDAALAALKKKGYVQGG